MHVSLARCKQCVIQFVIVKPVMAIGTLTSYTMNDSHEVDWWTTTASVIYNVSYTFALYGLVRRGSPNVTTSWSCARHGRSVPCIPRSFFQVLFYMATKTFLTQFHPVSKFVAVSSVRWALCCLVLASPDVLFRPCW